VVADVREPRLLLLETSAQAGQVALAEGDRLLEVRRLDEARRHARDLVPAVRDLLVRQGWQARALDAVLVSRGPGSYTGLRVGIMSAKTLAYASGCTLLAIDTFGIVACQAPGQALMLDVLADAQQDKVYVQRFVRSRVGEPLAPADALAIRPFADWLGSLPQGGWVTGPGLRKYGARLPEGVQVVKAGDWEPAPDALLQLGQARFRRGEGDDLWTTEPLYLRPSSAEEQWAGK
jgi:tRNA threonylcarbamoyladenosine biosynthesis protein TsaB